MRISKILASVFVLSLLCPAAVIGRTGQDEVYHQAKHLYEDHLYLRSRALFETISGDPVTDGYIVLCALYSDAADAGQLVENYSSRYGKSSLTPQIDWRRAVICFEAGDFKGALELIESIKPKELYSSQREEYAFKRAYCLYECQDYDSALKSFGKIGTGRYRIPAYFYSAVINYTRKNYSGAEELFSKCVGDPRFGQLSSFYIVDCEFNSGNYDYVVTKGIEVFESTGSDRRMHLARLISEAYLVLGEKKKAREYYDQASHTNMTVSDYFFAASVMNAVEDYPGAIENYRKYLNENSSLDSLWQVANYNLAGAYLRTGNMVGAMDAFKFASEVSYDPRMTEDAMFNYAKLAFDLNKDTSGFTRYIKTYSTANRDDIYMYMALAALYDRNYSAAVDAYDNIEYLTPDMRSNYAKANYLRASQLISSGAYSDAVKCLKAAAFYIPKSDSFNQLSRYWLAESYYKAGDYAFAGEIFQDLYNAAALDRQSESALLPYNVAYCLLKQKDYAGAARWFDKYIASDGAVYREDAMLRRADCDFARKLYRDAVKSYGAVTSEFSDVNKVYPYYKRAMSYGLTGDKQAKLKTLSPVENASPSAEYYFEAMSELGNAYMDQKRTAEAVRVFTKLRENATDDKCRAVASIGLGMAFKNLKNYEEALNYYKDVVAVMPGTEYSDDALAAIQSIYQTLGTPEKYLAFVESGPNAGNDAAQKEQLYFTTAEQIYLAGRFNDALVSFDQFVSSYPESERLADSYFYMADCYKNLGETEKSCSYFSKVVNAGGGNNRMPALLNFAVLSYKLERYTDALGAYRQLKSESADSSQAHICDLGVMRSAYRAKAYDDALKITPVVYSSEMSDDAIRREALYIQAKSNLSTSRRDEAIADFNRLASESMSTREGAEAKCFLIQNLYDNGEFDKVESSVFEFSGKAGDQLYWLAKAYVILGDTFVQKGMLAQAKATFESIRDGYEPFGPDDEVLENVKLRLERLENE